MTSTTYALDDRKLLCRHCGRASWRHRLVRGVGLLCRDSDTRRMAETAQTGSVRSTGSAGRKASPENSIPDQE